MRISIMIGGAQGSGVETASNILSNAIANYGYMFYGKREYYSNIKGRHSYFQVEVSDTRVHSTQKDYDMLVSFDKETLFMHLADAGDGATIIHSANLAGTIDSAVSLEEEAKERAGRLLEGAGLTKDVAGALEFLKRKNAKFFPIDYTGIMGEVSKKVANADYDTLIKSINMQAMAAAACLLGISLEDFSGSINKFLSKRKGGMLAEINLAAAASVYEKLEYASVFNIKKLEHKKMVQVNGNTVEGLAKILCGIRFQSYYPITPASDESTFIEQNSIVKMKDGTTSDIVVLQTEDEIAAVTSAIGATLAGVRASTSTSGPGFSLMVEGMGWAGINEVPLVVSFYMRGGPSTGLPTRNSQSDLMFAINCGHGEFAKVVYSTGLHEDIINDVALVFNLAERYQCPAIHLVDKALASSVSALPYELFDVKGVSIDRGSRYKGDPYEYLRFKLTENGVSPRAHLGEALFWNTGDEHNEEGHITEDPELRIRMYEKRMRKMDDMLKGIPLEAKFREYGDRSSDIAAITFGTPVGTLMDVQDMLKADGISLHIIEAKLMDPFPSEDWKGVLKGKRTIISVEANYVGQLAQLLMQKTGIAVTAQVLKWTGRPMDCDETCQAIKDIVQKNEKKVVLRNGE